MLDDLFHFLRDQDFQDPESGSLNFPAYIYAYPADQEYAFREALPGLCQRLQRPPIHQVPLALNIFDCLVDHLRDTGFGNRSYLDIVLQEEQDAPRKTQRLIDEVLGEGSGFYARMHERIREHQEAGDDATRSYVFIHGWGTIHPYLRAHQFMGCIEPFVDGYKLILLYPGECDGGRLRFLGRVEGRGPYRAQCLNDQIGDGSPV